MRVRNCSGSPRAARAAVGAHADASRSRNLSTFDSPPFDPPPGLADLLREFPTRSFERGEVLIENTYGQPTRVRRPALAYVVEGLVRGVRNRSMVAPTSRATVLVAGDGRWLGFDAFKFGENLLRYVAMTPTVAAVIPLEHLDRTTPGAVLIHMLRDVSLQWWTVASVMSLGPDTLRRRTLLLLCDLRRLHARPEIELRQSDIADLLGIRRQTLQPVLKELERAGLVSLGYREITVGNAQALLAALVADGGGSSGVEGDEAPRQGPGS